MRCLLSGCRRRAGFLARGLLLWFCLAAVPWAVRAHNPSDSYLALLDNAGKLSGQWDLALHDLEAAIGLDSDQDGRITWREITAAREAIESYARERLTFRAGGRDLDLEFGDLMLDEHFSGIYVVVPFEVAGLGEPSAFEVEYRALFDHDPLHRGLCRFESEGRTQTAVFGPDNRVKTFTRGAAGGGAGIREFVWQGVWHIWIGYDHILFLLTLLLPALARRRDAGWVIHSDSRVVVLGILKTVTAFTVAHSITLAVATLGWVNLPARWVESVIAASIVVAALLNLFPRIRAEGWMVASGFGLIHGFGFASVLGDLGLSGGSLLANLAAFNVGVELGQLAIVAVFLPALWWFRRHPAAYRRTLAAASIIIALLAFVWTVDRAFEVQWLAW